MLAKDILPVLILQLKNNFALTDSESEILSDSHIYEVGYERAVECFRNSNCKYFNEQIGLNPFNSVMYTNYLYQVSHLLYKEGFSQVADKVYYLNKMLNAVDLFYAIELPCHWNCEHPLGSVMGRAQYGDNFFFYQGCTVGGTKDKNGTIFYPTIERNVSMFANSSVLGKSHIGENVKIGAGCIVKNQDVPNNSIVFGQSPNLVIKGV